MTIAGNVAERICVPVGRRAVEGPIADESLREIGGVGGAEMDSGFSFGRKRECGGCAACDCGREQKNREGMCGVPRSAHIPQMNVHVAIIDFNRTANFASAIT